MGGFNSILMSLTHSKQVDVRGVTTQAHKHTVQYVGYLLLSSVDALLDRALCGPAGLTWRRTDPSSGPHDDRSDCTTKTNETSGNLCIKHLLCCGSVL